MCDAFPRQKLLFFGTKNDLGKMERWASVTDPFFPCLKIELNDCIITKMIMNWNSNGKMKSKCKTKAILI